jgi:peptidoglycan hydrolase CwlO-like protein
MILVLLLLLVMLPSQTIVYAETNNDLKPRKEIVAKDEQLNTFRHGNTDLCTKISVFLGVFIWMTEV